VEYNLTFAKQLIYDNEQDSISIATKIKYVDQKISFTAKLDTGASLCIFKRDLADELGIEVENTEIAQRVRNANGDIFKVFGHFVTIEIADFEFECLVYFAEKFLAANVFGKRGFLDKFKIAIDDNEGKLFLSEL
jgi:hypothetical protein